MLEHGCDGIHYKISPKHLHQYVGEISGRHNVCGEDMIDQIREVVAKMEWRFLPYRMLDKDNGLDNEVKS